MEEEIDIIELFKRVKEGKAPRKIEVNGNEYCFEENVQYGDYRRESAYTYIYLSNEFDIRGLLKLKIKILDKPIIEELGTIIGDLEDPSYNEIMMLNWIRNNRNKINEIIQQINNEENENGPK